MELSPKDVRGHALVGPAPLVSVIVPVRDDPRIDDLLFSLAAQKDAPPFEVLVALDGARREPISPAGLQVRLLAGVRAGPYAARNRAIREARGHILLLTDSDCVCPPDWVATAAAAFADPTLQVLQGGSAPLVRTRLALAIQREYERYVASHEAAGFRYFCNTRNLGLRRETARALAFRENLARGGDGVYGLELERAGIPIRHVPEWTILHWHPRSRWREGWAAFEQGRQGALWQAEGFDLFGEAGTTSGRGPGARLARTPFGGPRARRMTAAGLLGVAALLAAASTVLPGGAGNRAFSRFRRAAHLAGRFAGEAAAMENRQR